MDLLYPFLSVNLTSPFIYLDKLNSPSIFIKALIHCLYVLSQLIKPSNLLGGQYRNLAIRHRLLRNLAIIVITIIVLPCSFNRLKISIISTPVLESSAPVGSSAKIIGGSPAIVRAMATRCCCPPDSSDGKCFRRSSKSTVSSA